MCDDPADQRPGPPRSDRVAVGGDVVDKGEAEGRDDDEDALSRMQDAPGRFAVRRRADRGRVAGRKGGAGDDPVDPGGGQGKEPSEKKSGSVRATFVVGGLEFKTVTHGDKLLKTKRR